MRFAAGLVQGLLETKDKVDPDHFGVVCEAL